MFGGSLLCVKNKKTVERNKKRSMTCELIMENVILLISL